MSKFHKLLTICKKVSDFSDATLSMSKTMEEKEFQVLFKHRFSMNKNTIETKVWLDKCYENSAPSKATVKRWFAEFKRGHTDTNDVEHSGRPNEVVIPNNIKKYTKSFWKIVK
ncbi:hypothetical protein O3G_MSEX000703 [Manduca sexta]|nr:hypothetical protein O3G_MSEX000703 [Manduca sexta]